MSRRLQGGFTLIEVTLVMAISSALVLLAISGFTLLRAQAQFSDAVERAKEEVLAKRQEALSTIKLSGGGISCTTKADQCNVTVGRLLTFTPGSSTVQVQTLYTANSDNPASNQPVYVLASENSSFRISWGVTFTGPRAVQVAFVRSVVDGSLQTAVSPAASNGWSGPPYDYGNFAPGGPAVDIPLSDGLGRNANLHIDPASNGVTRSFL